jgi:hypothetical protein
MSLLSRLLGRDPKRDEQKASPKAPAPEAAAAEPVSQPQPPMDGKKPIPSGTDQVEKFMVSTDTGGGD